MIDCKILLIVVLIISLLLLLKKSNKLYGGTTTNTSSIKEFRLLENMIKNDNLSDVQILEKLRDLKKENTNIVKAKENIYNNILTNLSSTDNEIETAELNLEDAKNNLLLASINLELKSSIIKKNMNRIKEKNKLYDFYVELNTVKQYNLYTLILMSNIKKLRQYVKISPNSEKFKKDLLTNTKSTAEFANEAYIKTDNLYKKIISSDHPKIISYKSDLSNSKNIAKELKNNIEIINNRLKSQAILDKSIKDKLIDSKNEEIKNIEKEETSLFDSLKSLFKGL